MQIIRTVIWVLVLVAVLVFSFFNWREVEVTIWDNLVLETKVPALVIISFLLGFLPTWLISRGVIWSLNRKIRSLEIAAKASSVSAAAREADREEAARQDLASDEADPEASVAQAAPDEETLTVEPPVEEAPAEEPPAEETPVDDTPAEEPAPAKATWLTTDEPEAEQASQAEETPAADDTQMAEEAATDAPPVEDTPQDTLSREKPDTP